MNGVFSGSIAPSTNSCEYNKVSRLSNGRTDRQMERRTEGTNETQSKKACRSVWGWLVLAEARASELRRSHVLTRRLLIGHVAIIVSRPAISPSVTTGLRWTRHSTLPCAKHSSATKPTPREHRHDVAVGQALDAHPRSAGKGGINSGSVVSSSRSRPSRGLQCFGLA